MRSKLRANGVVAILNQEPGGVAQAVEAWGKMTILLGIVEGFIGGFIMNLLGGAGTTGFNLWAVVVATIRAFILLAIYRMVTGRRV